MPYKVILKNRAIKVLTKVNEPAYSKLKEAIYNLANNPRPQGYKKLKGRLGFRIRVGDYRVIYEIDDLVYIIEVLDVGHRKDIYD